MCHFLGGPSQPRLLLPYLEPTPPYGCMTEHYHGSLLGLFKLTFEPSKLLIIDPDLSEEEVITDSDTKRCLGELSMQTLVVSNLHHYLVNTVWVLSESRGAQPNESSRANICFPEMILMKGLCKGEAMPGL